MPVIREIERDPRYRRVRGRTEGVALKGRAAGRSKLDADSISLISGEQSAGMDKEEKEAKRQDKRKGKE